MFDLVFTEFARRATAWREEVQLRRDRSAVDPVADAMESCARDLEATIRKLELACDRLTTEQYATLHGTTPQTVTRWIRNGELDAEKTATGDYLIARLATRHARIRLERAG